MTGLLLASAVARAEEPAASSPANQTVVTAARTPRPLRDVPETVIILPRDELTHSPALQVDDVLRTVPSVGLFRRTSSAAADPTSQGINLRGVGPSAVSR